MTQEVTKKTEEVANKTFVLEFPTSLKKTCPRCKSTIPEITHRISNLTAQSEMGFKRDQESAYNRYFDRCESLFKENAWPLCFDCYSSGISGVEKCSECRFPLMGAIFCRSTSGYEIGGSHVCNYCEEELKKKVDLIKEKKRKQQLQQKDWCFKIVIYTKIE